MAKYLITGGAGFIGSHLAEALCGQGQETVVLDNLSSGKPDNLLPAQKGPGPLSFIEGDIRDPETCLAAMAGVDYVLHQAARPSVQLSLQNPNLTNEVNVAGGLNVLRAAKEAGVKRVVLASSSSVYGDRADVAAPKKETMDPRPMSPYAASKVAMEYYSQAFGAAFGLQTVNLRYFNVFGPRQDPASEYAAVIPKFVFAVLGDRQPVIYGDGRQSRDFTHVSNVVAANLAACQSPAAVGKAINVAAGQSYDLLSLLEQICRFAGRRVEPRFAPPRSGDVRHSLADLSLAREVLGYQVDLDLGAGLKQVVELARRGAYLA